MFLLSRIISWDMEKHAITTEYDVGEGSLFYREGLGGLPAWAGFELMAQSISALSGLKAGGKGRYGFILSVSDLRLHVPALRGTVRIEVIEEASVSGVNSVYVFRGSLFSEAREAAEAKLTVMDVEDLSAVRR
jgi:predicted hotdog family 3-hydroxylacyl-ACP dehydratase